jgi:2-dehydropantoate 2-reductase
MNKTKNEIQSLCILGAGAVGCFYGLKLQNYGIYTEFQSRNMYNSSINNMKIKSIWGDFESQLKVHETPLTMKKSDLVIISTKVTHFDTDLKTIIEYLKIVSHEKTILLFLQNGINFEENIQVSFPNNPVLGGLAFTCINRVSLDEIHHIDYGKVKIGSNLKDFDNAARAVVEIFQRSGIDTEYLPNLRFGRYEKLLWNIPFNSLSVLFKSKTDLLVSEGTSLELAKNLMFDVYKIARKDNVLITKKMIQDMILRTINMKPYKTSMLLDYEAGRDLEIESILGEPLRIAQKLKVKAPNIENMYYILKHITKSPNTLNENVEK